MKERKGLVYFFATLVGVTAVFNIIAFTIPFNRTASFWIAYGFTMSAIVVSFATSFYAFRGDLKSKFYGFSLIYLAWIYLIVQTIIGLMFMIISGTPYQIPLIICILLLAFYLAGMMATDMTKGYVENVDKRVKENTFFIKSLQLDMAEMSSAITDSSLENELKELIDDIKYSDPVSADQLKDTESSISEKVSVLKELVTDGNIDDALGMIKDIRKLIALRNQKCKLLK